jgi:hypothetical protein
VTTQAFWSVSGRVIRVWHAAVRQPQTPADSRRGPAVAEAAAPHRCQAASTPLCDPCEMDLPAPDAPDDLIEYLDERAASAEDWHGISAALRERERAGDLQAGWLMTAFDYGLARRVGKERGAKDAFVAMMSAGGSTYPTPVVKVPPEVIVLWSGPRSPTE